MLAKISGRLKDFFVNKVLGVHDTPHRIALGVGIGIFITWLPVIGAQMVLIVFFSVLFRANKVVGAPFAWITNPATLWIYIPNYFLGCKVMGSTYDVDVLWDGLTKAFGLNTGSFHERCVGVWNALVAVFWPLFVGSAIVGGILGVITYFIIRRAVIKFRHFRHENIMTGLPLEKAQPPEAAPTAAADTEPVGVEKNR